MGQHLSVATPVDMAAFHTDDMAVNRVPPEIWLKIFAHAVWVPGIFSVSDYHIITAYSRYGYGLIPRRLIAMKTKLAMSLVCSSWNRLCQQFLFEHLVIRSGEQAIRLAGLLGDSSAAISGTPGRGRWTIRVDIALPHRSYISWKEEYTSAVISIIRSCPNLVSFSNFHDSYHEGDPFPHVYTRLVSVLGGARKLKRLELKGHVFLSRNLISVLADTLEVLILRVLYLHPSSTQLDRWTCTLPLLKTFISIGDSRGVTEYLNLPALWALSVDVDPIPAIQKHGSLLRYLHMDALVGSVFPPLLLCPGLETLALGSRRHPMGEDDTAWSLVDLPIQTLILYDTTTVNAPWWPVGGFNNNILEHISFSALRSIRIGFPLSSWPLLRNARVGAAWKEWLEICSHHGVRAEVSQGAERLAADEWRVLTV